MTFRLTPVALTLVTLVLAGCGKPHTAASGADGAPAAAGGAVDAAAVADPAAPVHMTTVLPSVPGDGGGVAANAPFDPGSPRGAVDVLKVYYSMLGAKRYADARIWWEVGAPSEPSSDPAFAASFDRYESYVAQVGEPGAPEGAAGSMRLTVPVVIHARLKAGGAVTEQATAQLHRINDTAEAAGRQMSWRIVRVDTQPSK